jgi:predicted nucleic acid-binding protein
VEDLVVDSGVTIKWFVDEPHQERARDIFEGRRAGLLRLLAPDLIYAEFGNVLWKKHSFQGLSPEDAGAALSAFRRLPLLITPAADLLDEAYRLAVAHRRSVYDALYLALSRREGCRFVTADERLVNAAGGAFPNIVHIADWNTPRA